MGECWCGERGNVLFAGRFCTCISLERPSSVADVWEEGGKAGAQKTPVSQRLPGRPCPGAPLPCVRCAQGLAPECQQRRGRGHVPARGLAE